MSATVRDLIVVLQAFFPANLPLSRALYVIASLATIYPLLRLHQNQITEPRQPRRTAWMKSIGLYLQNAFYPEELHPEDWEGTGPRQFYADEVIADVGPLYELLGFTTDQDQPHPTTLFPPPRFILCTRRVTCIKCSPDVQFRTLRRRQELQSVRILEAGCTWTHADLYVAHCVTCLADYYPDKIVFKNGELRVQELEINAPYLRISKHGIWASREIAQMQDHAFLHFHAGWSNFTNWVNDNLPPDTTRITNCQSQRLFMEHFGRRLLVAHNKTEGFCCPANSATQSFTSAIRDAVGKDGGVIVDSLYHACIDCTHKKRYRSDLVAEGVELDAEGGALAAQGAVEAEHPNDNADDQPAAAGNMPPVLPQNPPVQNEPPPDAPRGYVRMAVMDGKTIGHRICAMDDCKNPLVNFKNGRFCEDHLGMQVICGIIPCGRPVASQGALTCDDPAHQTWYKQWNGRFARLSFPGVQRVIRQQHRVIPGLDEGGPGQQGHGHGPPGQGGGLHLQLPNLGNTPGHEVTHTFRARSVYCLQTIQWACGTPIGWGKCYKSESAPQVLAILDRIWEHHPELRPSFIGYDDACDLLRHIATQDIESPWIKSTKFIVDAWHYIGHRATDILCRLWCNPAPTNGSQPDLIQIQEDENGVKHQTRAYNTETAEQLNAWIDGYESQMRQMTDINHDFVAHVVMMLYKELVEQRIEKKGRQLPDDFWLEYDLQPE